MSDEPSLELKREMEQDKIFCSHQLNSDGVKNKTIHKLNIPQNIEIPVSLKDFLDLLAAAYRVNDALDNYPLSCKKGNVINWNQLSLCKFVPGMLENKENVKGSTRKSANSEKENSTLPNEFCIVRKFSITDKSTPFPYESSKSFEPGTETQHEEEEMLPNRFNSKKSSRGNNKLHGRSSSLVGNINANFINRQMEKVSTEKQKNSLAKKDSVDRKCKMQTEFDSVEQMKSKLYEVLQDGILDSILPYVVPKKNTNMCFTKKSGTVIELKKNPEKTMAMLSNQTKENNSVFRSKKQYCTSDDAMKENNKDIEVEIHVCDEVKNLKKDFRCSQKLLVSKMGYFAEVTTGQKLEDMDISVHCDITIFEWLMRWVKKDPSKPELTPTLDATNVIPVLVSAAFLQMDPLLNDCLKYCREHMNEILRVATNLSCLNDSIVTRLANQFKNVEIEAMRDKKDKMQSRLFCKLILSLTEPKPDPRRGHYSSLAHLFQCIHCGKLLSMDVCIYVPCRPAHNRMDFKGTIQGIHLRDPEWNLTEYVKFLRTELKCWRHVYWRLWGESHFLLCATCHIHYSVCQSDWCCYHSDTPQFFTMEQHRSMSFPIGRYPCCGERAYRFEVLQNPNGCTFRSHVPVLDSNKTIEINDIFQAYRSLIALDPPQLVFQERLTRLVRNNRDGSRNDEKDCVLSNGLWWHGLELAPPCSKISLVSRIWEKPKEHKIRENPNELNNAGMNTSRQQIFVNHISYSEVSESSGNTTSSPETTERDSSSPSLGEDNSEGSICCSRPVRKSIKKKNSSVFIPNQPSQWMARYSTRYNQDNQRDYEEWSLRTIITMLSRRYGELYYRGNTRGRSSQWRQHFTPLGGTYIRLETQWREDHIHLYQNSRGRTVGTSHSMNRGRSLVPSRARPRSNLR